MAAKKTITKEVPYSHRDDAEWLTHDICNEYRKRAIALGANNISARNELQKELEWKCDITPLEALNILNGYHAVDYVTRYERMKNHTAVEVADSEYLEWLSQKEIEEQSHIIGEFDIEGD